MPEIVITVNAKMDSKKGIEKVAPVDAQAVELLDPLFLGPETHDAAMADRPGSGRVVRLGRASHLMNTLDGNQTACTSGY